MNYTEYRKFKKFFLNIRLKFFSRIKNCLANCLSVFDHFVGLALKRLRPEETFFSDVVLYINIANIAKIVNCIVN